MFVCLDCGKIFETPYHCIDRHGFDTPPYEEWDESPCCGANYADVLVCDGCMDYITDDYIKLVNGDRYCSECFRRYELGDED